LVQKEIITTGSLFSSHKRIRWGEKTSKKKKEKKLVEVLVEKIQGAATAGARVKKGRLVGRKRKLVGHG